jgi:hypothetical protein
VVPERTMNNAVKMRAQFDGRCHGCGDKIKKRERILWLPSVGAFHPKCWGVSHDATPQKLSVTAQKKRAAAHMSESVVRAKNNRRIRATRETSGVAEAEARAKRGYES